MYYVEFGEILRAKRKESGLSQLKLATLAGLNRAVISKYENALSYPPYNVLIRFARVFKVSTDYLLGIEKAKTLNIEGLTAGQISSLKSIVNEYQRLNGVFTD
ncbi:MAG: helix-turn-helix domain-containing protein [Oscillospiraceae bacterium]|jgi:transcriptional regulator with XRE-family HTH domain|nr:helix-turn-helix domain-containing protein [Oscillospiraceae bacterium]